MHRRTECRTGLKNVLLILVGVFQMIPEEGTTEDVPPPFKIHPLKNMVLY